MITQAKVFKYEIHQPHLSLFYDSSNYSFKSEIWVAWFPHEL